MIAACRILLQMIDPYRQWRETVMESFKAQLDLIKFLKAETDSLQKQINVLKKKIEQWEKEQEK